LGDLVPLLVLVNMTSLKSFYLA